MRLVKARKISCLICLLVLAIQSNPVANRDSAKAKVTPHKAAHISLNGVKQMPVLSPYSAAYALIIGMQDYKNPAWEDLQEIRESLEHIERALTQFGFTVETAFDLRGKQLAERIKKFISVYGREKDHGLLIYYAGHGYLMESEEGQEMGYIVPIDAPNPEKEGEAFRQIAVSMKKIRVYAEEIKAKHALFIFDSCFSGSLISASNKRATAYYPPFPGLVPDSMIGASPVPLGAGYSSIVDYYSQNPVRLFITSGTLRQKVSDDIAFREKFVRGLDGESNNNADFDSDGYVTGTELGKYLEMEVIGRRVGSQTPQYAKIEDPNLNRGDFIFVLPKKPEPVPLNSDPQLWRLPAVWPVQGGWVTAQGQGIALPKDVGRYSYRNLDFLIEFKLQNNIAAGFLVRARDPQNYYMIQLTGGDFPDKLRRLKLQAFVVQGGKKSELTHSPLSIDRRVLMKELERKNRLQMKIKVRGKEIAVEILSREGQRLWGPGQFVDDGFRIKSGMPGFIIEDKEQLQINIKSLSIVKLP